MKQYPCTITARWMGKARQCSRCSPVRMVPGSALMNSLVKSLDDSHRERAATDLHHVAPNSKWRCNTPCPSRACKLGYAGRQRVAPEFAE